MDIFKERFENRGESRIQWVALPFHAGRARLNDDPMGRLVRLRRRRSSWRTALATFRRDPAELRGRALGLMKLVARFAMWLRSIAGHRFSFANRIGGLAPYLAKFDRRCVRFVEDYSKLGGRSALFAGRPAKLTEAPAKFRGTPAKFAGASAKLADASAKLADQSGKLAD